MSPRSSSLTWFHAFAGAPDFGPGSSSTTVADPPVVSGVEPPPQALNCNETSSAASAATALGPCPNIKKLYRLLRNRRAGERVDLPGAIFLRHGNRVGDGFQAAEDQEGAIAFGPQAARVDDRRLTTNGLRQGRGESLEALGAPCALQLIRAGY